MSIDLSAPHAAKIKRAARETTFVLNRVLSAPTCSLRLRIARAPNQTSKENLIHMSFCMVPTARLELAQLSPLPPQDSVSTNFTTSARANHHSTTSIHATSLQLGLIKALFMLIYRRKALAAQP
jgi:hypothetical protein